jgi:hypothetical protein
VRVATLRSLREDASALAVTVGSPSGGGRLAVNGAESMCACDGHSGLEATDASCGVTLGSAARKALRRFAATLTHQFPCSRARSNARQALP